MKNFRPGYPVGREVPTERKVLFWFLLVTALALLLLSPLALRAQERSNTYYAAQFQGADVGTKIANAQTSCAVNVNLPCIIVVDAILSLWPQGTRPTICSNCQWIDYTQIGNVTFTGSGGVIDVSSFASGGNGTQSNPWTSPSGTGGFQEAINFVGVANGAKANLHARAGFYAIATCINATANITSIFANSASPSPLIIEGDGPSKTVLVGSTGGCVFDQTGRVVKITELAIIQGSSNKSTIGIYCSRGTGLVSQFSSSNLYEHLTIDLPTIPAANGGNGTAAFYNNACEANRYYNNNPSADHPYVITSNNIWGITSAYQTIAVNLHNFDSQNDIAGGSCAAEGVSSGECILLQGHASNTWIHNISGECTGATPPSVFLRIKAPTAPDAATDPLPGLNLQNIQYECPTGGQLIANEQVLTNAIIQGNVANVAATPVILLNSSTALIKDSFISLQMGNSAITEPLISDAGAATAGLQGGIVFLPPTTTISLTNAASTCTNVQFVASFNSPSITCSSAGAASGSISAFNSFTRHTAGTETHNADVSHVWNVAGVNSLNITTSIFQILRPVVLPRCASSASPSVCGANQTGDVALAAAATTLTVNTTAVTANSQIMVTENSSKGAALSVTCNTTAGRTYAVTAITAGTSFTITSSAAPVTNPACLSFTIWN